MGLIISASLLCDNCNTNTVPLASADAPLPDGWLKVSGYATMGGGDANAIMGYFCQVCIASQGVNALAKKADDISNLPIVAAPVPS